MDRWSCSVAEPICWCGWLSSRVVPHLFGQAPRCLLYIGSAVPLSQRLIWNARGPQVATTFTSQVLFFPTLPGADRLFLFPFFSRIGPLALHSESLANRVFNSWLPDPAFACYCRRSISRPPSTSSSTRLRPPVSAARRIMQR